MILNVQAEQDLWTLFRSIEEIRAEYFRDPDNVDVAAIAVLLDDYENLKNRLNGYKDPGPGVTCGHCGRRSTFEHVKQCREQTATDEGNQIIAAREALIQLLQEERNG